MAFDRWQRELDAYVDAELSSDEKEEMNAHLRNCAFCTSELLERVHLKRAVEIAGKRFTPTFSFRQRIHKALLRRQRQVWLWHGLPRLATATALLVVLVAGFSQWLSTRQERISAELADLHVTMLASSNPVDIVSSDRQTVKPWFEGKLPFTFELPDFGNSPFTLVGGRLSYVAQVPGAQLIFAVGNHRVSVFIFRNRSDLHLREADTASKQLTFNVESWSHDGLGYFAIGDASPQDIATLCELFRLPAGT